MTDLFGQVDVPCYKKQPEIKKHILDMIPKEEPDIENPPHVDPSFDINVDEPPLNEEDKLNPSKREIIGVFYGKENRKNIQTNIKVM